MKETNRIFFVVICVLFCIVLAEVSYYFSIRSTSKKISEGANSNSKMGLSQEDVSFLAKDRAYQDLKSLIFDNNTKQCNIDLAGTSYLSWRKKMGVDFDTWRTLSTYTKDTIDSLILIKRFKGTIVYIDTSNKQLKVSIVGSEGMITSLIENEESLKTTKFVKIVKGAEVPISMNDFINGDSVIIESKSDITKPLNDPKHHLEKKYIKTT
jgi:hypothetical protein